MIKLTARYPDEAELLHFLRIMGSHIDHCKPRLSKPAIKNPGSQYYRREIWLRAPAKNTGK